jgi:hypothetical protein
MRIEYLAWTEDAIGQVRRGEALNFVARLRKAIQSFRLRLHSGLRQSGSVFDAALYGTAEKPCP